MPDQRLHVADQMIATVGYEVSRRTHAEQYTTNSPTPPLLRHQWEPSWVPFADALLGDHVMIKDAMGANMEAMISTDDEVPVTDTR